MLHAFNFLEIKIFHGFFPRILFIFEPLLPKLTVPLNGCFCKFQNSFYEVIFLWLRCISNLLRKWKLFHRNNLMGAHIYLHISKEDLQKETFYESIRVLGFEIITFRRKVSRLVKDSWYFIVSFAGSVQICLIVIIETIMIRSNGKRQNITREVAPADRSKKLLDEKRSHDRDVLQSINHELIGSSSTLLITIDNKFYRKYNLWTNTGKSFDTYLHKNKQTIIQEAQATVIIS